MLSKKQISIFVLVTIIGIMTIPRSVIDYGAEGDAARSVEAADEFFSTGVYRPSRLPGTPLFEYLLAIVVPWGGHIASNLLVLTFYVVSVSVFSFLVRGRDANLLLTGTFALTPILLVNAVTTVDYIPGLALMLCCYICATKNRYILASIFLGLSIGFRISNVLFVIPVSLFLLLERRRIYEIIIFFFFSIFIGFVFYIPIFIRAGIHLFDFQLGAFPGPYYLSRVIYHALMLFGPLATIGILVVALANSKNIIQSIKIFRFRSASFILELTTIVIYAVLFMGHPSKTYYLIPIVPFFYLFISRWLSKRQLILIGVLIISFALFTVEFKGGKSGRRAVIFKPAWGGVVSDYINRNEMELLRAGIGKFEESDKAVIMTGEGPKLTYKNDILVRADCKEMLPNLLEEDTCEISDVHRIIGREVYLVYCLPRDYVSMLREQGYRIYMFPETAPSTAIHKYGYDPYQIGVKTLEIFNKEAFYKEKK